MKMDSFSPRRSYVPLRCYPDVPVLSAGPTRFKLAARLMPSVRRSPWFYGIAQNRTC